MLQRLDQAADVTFQLGSFGQKRYFEAYNCHFLPRIKPSPNTHLLQPCIRPC